MAALHGPERIIRRLKRPVQGPAVQQDERDAERYDDLEAFERLLQIAELADPFQQRAGRQWHLLGYFALRLEHSAAAVAAADDELDRDGVPGFRDR
jgi:hypothetical protein